MQHLHSFNRRHTWAPLLFGALALFSQTRDVPAQDLPKSQPKLLTIIKEQVKVGRNAAHSKFEAGYVAAFEKAKSPDYYLALTSMTGPAEAWYLIPHDSHAAKGEGMKRARTTPGLSADLDRLAAADAELISGAQSILALARPEFSAGTFPDLAKVRYYVITTIQIRPGHTKDFEEAAKTYKTIIERSAPKSSYRIYQVTAGMDEPTFLIFSSVENYADLDPIMAQEDAAFKDAKPEELAIMKKFGEIAQRMVSHHYEVDPVQSYVSKETRATDPEFWKKK